MSDEIEIVVTIPESEEPEIVEVVEPVVVTTYETAPEVLDELVSLREFKAASDEARILEAERVAAQALALAEIALIEPEVEEPEVIVEEIVEDTPPSEDHGPENSHAFFKKWNG